MQSFTNSRPDHQQLYQYLPVPITSPASSPASFSSTSRCFHPVLEGQTEYFNRAYVQHSQPETPEMSSYSSPSEYSYNNTSLRQTISLTELNQMRQTLRHRRVNTLTEIRRIERVLISLPNFMSDYMDEMTDAWGYYVSGNFLQELRGLTRQYPFSTELLEDAKARVYSDPKSSRSWNLAWLLLAKIKTEQMIPQYASGTANQPAMWGGIVPNPVHAQELANVLHCEWSRAVDQMLKHYPTPPTIDGGW